jgi:flavin-binding protein dodecin
VIAQSPTSFDAACQEAIKEAAKTVENDQITMYRVNGKISFLVEDSR